MKKAPKVKSQPVAIKSYTFDEIIKETQSRPPPKPLTPEQEREIDEIMKQLPGLIRIQVPYTPK